MKISVIIVNYNVARFTEQAVRALLASTAAQDLEVFVVDNASTDDSLTYLRQRFSTDCFSQVRILDAGSNLGFGRANNLAARQANGDYLLFLNPDTLPDEDLIASLIEFAENHPKMGALGVSMTNENGTFAPESRRGLPTPWTAFCKMSGLTALFPKSRRFGRYYMDYLPANQPHETEVVSGACMMVRNDGRCEWFDSDYFMYGEDVDLSYRLMQEGKTNYYMPAGLIHYKGESTNKTSFRYAHVFYGAMLIFLRKHFPNYAFWLRPIIGFATIAKATKGWLHGLWVGLRFRLSRRAGRAATHVVYFGTHGQDFMESASAAGLVAIVNEAKESTLPQGHRVDDVKGVDFVVYDLADFSRRAIIQHIRRTAGLVSLGLYDPETHQVIMHGMENKIGC